jgi:hypothetical protein
MWLTAQSHLSHPGGMALALTKSFPPERYVGALAWWPWLDFEGRTPTLVTCFGDILFTSATGYWFLDIAAGTFEPAWPDDDALTAELQTTQGQDRYLLAGLAVAAYHRGVEPADNEVYAFTLPHVLGGLFEIDNVTTMDFEAAVSLAGQIHQQVREVSPGRAGRHSSGERRVDVDLDVDVEPLRDVRLGRHARGAGQPDVPRPPDA